MKMEELYKNLNIEEKAILIKRQNPKEEVQPIQKPVISQRISELADKKRKKFQSTF